MNAPKRMLQRPSAAVTQTYSTPAQPAGNTLADMTAKLANDLMNARTSFHKLHLKITGPGSYSSHLALNELYDALPDSADSLVEQYQGACEMLLPIPDSCPVTLNTKEEGIQYIRTLKDCVTGLQSQMPYSEIVNDLDLIKSTLNSIKYKLLFLS